MRRERGEKRVRGGVEKRSPTCSLIPTESALDIPGRAVRLLARSLVLSFSRSFARSFPHSFARSLVLSFICSFVQSFICSFVESFTCSFVRSLARSGSLTRSLFTRSLVRLHVFPLCELVVTREDTG